MTKEIKYQNGRFDESAFIDAYRKTLKIGAACESIGIDASTFYKYHNTPELRGQMSAVLEQIKDFAEDCLISKLQTDTTALIFFLKTKAADRGYIERRTESIETDDELKQLAREFFAKD